MQVDAGAALTGIVLVVGVIVWAVRIEGRINLTDALFHEMKADISEIKGDVKAIRRDVR